MCIIALAHGVSPLYPLIVAANRDESHARPTQRADWWEGVPILGGRDAAAGGSWLAMDRKLRLAAVTNLRNVEQTPAPRSRGLLVSRFLAGRETAARFAHSLGTAQDFAPFNLLLFDRAGLIYASNRTAAPQPLAPGVHALSNAEPGAEWPKVARARAGLAALLEEPDPVEPLFELLAERRPAAGGFDERQESLFLRHPVWGTRSSTVVLVDNGGTVRFIERSFDASGVRSAEVRIEFAADAPL